MKKKWKNDVSQYKRGIPKFILIMKLTIVLTLVLTLTVSAETYSQNTKLNLSLENATIEQVLLEIENNSKFVFIYESGTIDKSVIRTISVKNQSIDAILLQLLEGTDVNYKIDDRQVLLFRNESPISTINKLGTPSIAVQQPKSISGKVTDSSGSVLPGVTVMIKGTTKGTITDRDGNYILPNVPENGTLVFSFVGMKTQEIVVSGKIIFNISMEEDAIGIEEVVAVGYGAVTKRDLTGSVASISTKSIMQTTPVTFESGLLGRAAGVQVITSEGGPDAGMRIQIRGTTSLNADNSPLYVVDGYPVSGENESTGNGIGISTTSPLASINPRDIKSIEVLKDASATAIYGSRGANGVVLITTVQGAEGAPKVSFNTSIGFSGITRNVDVMSPDEFLDYYHETAPQDTISYYDRSTGQRLPASSFRAHDWQREIYRNSIQQNYNLSLSGGNKGSNYFGSIGYSDYGGIVKTSSFKRYDGSLRINQKINNKFNMGISLRGAWSFRNGIISATTGSGPTSGIISNILLFRPVIPGRAGNAASEFDENGELLTDRNGDIVSPKYYIENTIKTDNNFQAFGNTYMTYSILKGLDFKVSLGFNYNTGRGNAWFPGNFGYGRSMGGGLVSIQHTQSIGFVNENTLTYNQTFNNIHRLNGIVGFTVQKQEFGQFRTQASGFNVQNINIDNIGGASNFRPSSSDANHWGLLSYLSRVNYTFKDKYLMTLSGRLDGSSRFAEGHQYGFFPSMALAWRISEENFLKSISFIDDFKLRASYGLTGNNGIGQFKSLSSYMYENYSFNGSFQTGLVSERIANESLTWEKTKQIDLGFDLTLFDSRIFVSADAYRKETNDLLLAMPLPYTTGYSTFLTNIGRVSNKGLEFTLQTTNITTNSFKWLSSFNISFNKSNVLNLGDADQYLLSGPGPFTEDYIIKVGEQIGSMYGYVFDGAYQYEDFVEFEGLSLEDASKLFKETAASNTGFTLKEGIPYKVDSNRPGYIKFKDLDGDGQITDEDRTILGRANPKYFGGLSNTLSYKSISIDVLFRGSYGNSVMNKNMERGTSVVQPFFNQLGIMRNRWNPDRPSDIYGTYGNRDGGGNNIVSSFIVEDGSFIKLSNITMSYSPELKTKIFSTLRLYVSADNIYSWDSYSGYDPEVSIGNSALTGGIDFGAYPRERTFRIGIETTF